MVKKRIRKLFLFSVLCLALCACSSDEGGEITEQEPLTFPHTVTLAAEQALVAPTGEIIDNADFVKGDVVTFTNQTIKISSGGPKLTECQPMHVCRATPNSKPDVFDSFDQVCMNPPESGETYSIPNANAGWGFTVKLNSAEGCGRFWVKEVKGMGQSAKVTLVYSIFACSI